MNTLRIKNLIGGAKGPEIVDYLLQAALQADTDFVILGLTSAATGVDAENPGKDAAAFRDVWAQHLTAPNARLRSKAVVETAEMMLRVRMHSKGRDNSDALQAQLEQIAAHDPDPDIRRTAAEELQDVRNATWREEP